MTSLAGGHSNVKRQYSSNYEHKKHSLETARGKDYKGKTSKKKCFKELIF